MIIAYSRVSSKEQDQEKYRAFFARYEQTFQTQFDNIILETISASKTNLEDRELWKHINNPVIKKIVVLQRKEVIWLEDLNKIPQVII